MNKEFQTVILEIANVTVSPERMRKEFGTEKMEELKSSIKEKGMINPITVNLKDGKYELLAGERRFRACKELEYKSIPARIYEDASTLDMKEIEAYENLHRDNLTWAEEVAAKKTILDMQMKKRGKKTSWADKDGTSQNEVAKMLGVSAANFQRDIELAEASAVFPALKNAKTKADANSMLNKLKRQYAEQKSVEKMEERLKKEGVSDQDMKVRLHSWFIVEDFFKGIAEISEGIVDWVECDWPYGVDLNKVKKGENPIDPYNEIDAKEYPSFIDKVFQECYRVTKRDAWMICWFAPEPWFETVYQAALKAGWKGRRLCGEWIKGTGQTNQPSHYLANASEWFFYFCKGSPAMHKPGRINTFSYAPVPAASKRHKTERPVELIQDIVDTFAYPGTLGVVPFIGSGNTLLAAANLNMTAFGYEINKENRTSYLVKVEKEEPGKYRSYNI